MNIKNKLLLIIIFSFLPVLANKNITTMKRINCSYSKSLIAQINQNASSISAVVKDEEKTSKTVQDNKLYGDAKNFLIEKFRKSFAITGEAKTDELLHYLLQGDKIVARLKKIYQEMNSEEVYFMTKEEYQKAEEDILRSKFPKTIKNDDDYKKYVFLLNSNTKKNNNAIAILISQLLLNKKKNANSLDRINSLLAMLREEFTTWPNEEKINLYSDIFGEFTSHQITNDMFKKVCSEKQLSYDYFYFFKFKEFVKISSQILADFPELKEDEIKNKIEVLHKDYFKPEEIPGLIEFTKVVFLKKNKEILKKQEFENKILKFKEHIQGNIVPGVNKETTGDAKKYFDDIGLEKSEPVEIEKKRKKSLSDLNESEKDNPKNQTKDDFDINISKMQEGIGILPKTQAGILMQSTNNRVDQERKDKKSEVLVIDRGVSTGKKGDNPNSSLISEVVVEDNRRSSKKSGSGDEGTGKRSKDNFSADIKSTQLKNDKAIIFSKVMGVLSALGGVGYLTRSLVEGESVVSTLKKIPQDFIGVFKEKWSKNPLNHFGKFGIGLGFGAGVTFGVNKFLSRKKTVEKSKVELT